MVQKRLSLITTKMIRSICYQNGQTLQTLDLNSCCGVKIDAIQKITKHCVGLKNVDLFDVYMGDKLPEGKKSYALSFILQDDQKTLTDKQIDKIMSKLQEGFKKQFEAELR